MFYECLLLKFKNKCPSSEKSTFRTDTSKSTFVILHLPLAPNKCALNCPCCPVLLSFANEEIWTRSTPESIKQSHSLERKTYRDNLEQADQTNTQEFSHLRLSINKNFGD